MCGLLMHEKIHICNRNKKSPVSLFCCETRLQIRVQNIYNTIDRVTRFFLRGINTCGWWSRPEKMLLVTSIVDRGVGLGMGCLQGQHEARKRPQLGRFQCWVLTHTSITGENITVSVWINLIYYFKIWQALHAEKVAWVLVLSMNAICHNIDW